MTTKWKLIPSSLVLLAVSLAPEVANASPIGNVCRVISGGDFDRCAECVELACSRLGIDVAACMWEHMDACYPNPPSETLPEINPDTLPEINLWNLPVLVIGASTGYVIYRYGGKIMGWLTGPSVGGIGFAPAAVLIGLPFILGTASAHAFEDFVQNYNPCINGTWNGEEYVCLGNSVANGPGAPGSECPPGTQPQTGMFGTACVQSPMFTVPPPPACDSLLACEQQALSGGGPTGCNDEVATDIEVVCIDAAGATSTGLSCTRLCLAADAADVLPL